MKVGSDSNRLATLAREAALYRVLGRSRALAPYLVRCFGFDPLAGALVVAAIPNARALEESDARIGGLTLTVSRAIGRALAILHNADWSSSTSLAGRPLRLPPPGALQLHEPGLQTLRHMSVGAEQVIAIIQETAHFSGQLEILSRRWCNERLIHNDFRFANCLVTRGRPAGRIFLVDWEMAGHGDPTWDLGCVFAEFLAAWLMSSPLGGGVQAARVPVLARRRLASLQPHIRAFWQAYTAQSPSLGDVSALLARAVPFAGARLVQKAIEQEHGRDRLTARSVHLLQLGLNILERPAQACDSLLKVGS